MFKAKFLFLAIAVAAISSLSAFASDGTINFTGKVSNVTCTINVNGSGSKNAFVTLPEVSVTALPSVGSVAGRTPFTIALTNCSFGASVSTYFEPSSTLNTGTGTLLDQDGVAGAQNVDIQLLNSAFGVIDLRQGANAQGDISKLITSGSATLQYYAQYYATGVAQSGGVDTSTTYSIIYQ